MFEKTTRTSIVIHEVERLLDAGYTDKNKIVQTVVENLGIPRPTIRRIIRDMRNDMMRKIKILQSEIPLPE